MASIPTRYEQLGDDPSPLIIGVEQDLQALERLRRATEVQHGGVLSVLYAPSGTGKTTAVHSTSALLADRWNAVAAVPSTVPMADVHTWISANCPETGKTTPVLIDHREKSDDDVALGQMMSGLNGLVRQRSDIVVLWPTTDENWRDQLVGAARKVGGRTLLPTSGVLTISGPAPEQWPEILDRLLIQLDQSPAELALSPQNIDEYAAEAEDIGGFLELIRDAVVDQVDDVRLTRKLPQVLFVITSDSPVVGEANRLRRAGSLVLKAEELVSYSRRSEAGKYWIARQDTPEHHLAYILSLFNARLVTMTPSAVSYAALHHGDTALAQLSSDAGLTRNKSNARTTFMTSDFYRLLTNTTSLELTSTSKGKTSTTALNAYTAIQAKSATRHKAINTSICALAEQVVPEFAASEGDFEVDLGNANTFADAVIPWGEETLHLEFHHLSPRHCKASGMANYMMEKLQGYAINYNLIPR